MASAMANIMSGSGDAPASGAGGLHGHKRARTHSGAEAHGGADAPQQSSVAFIKKSKKLNFNALQVLL